MTLPYVKTGSSIRRLHPLSCSITLNVKPLSTVRMTLPQTDEISIWEWVTVPVPDGSTIWCQVVTIETDAETGRKEIYLEHGARTLDGIILRRPSTLDERKTFSMKDTVPNLIDTILAGQSRWTAGTISCTQTLYIEPESMSITTAILTLMESIPAYQCDFVQASENDWHIDIKPRPTAVQAEARLSRNLKSCEISLNASAICTRVYCDGITGGKMDSSNLSTYGVHEETMSLKDELTTAQKEAIVTAYLAAHDHPTVSLSISGWELAALTGLTLDSFALGQVCRVAVPWLGITQREVVVSKTYQDAYNEPEAVTLSLADQTPDLSIVVASITGGGGGGGGAGKGGKEAEKKRFETKFEQSDQYFRLIATDTQWDDLGHGTLTAYGQLVITSSSIQQVISSVGQDGQVTAASITLAINNSGSNVIISADHIDINGLVTKLEAMAVGVGSLHVEGAAEFLRYIYAEDYIYSEETVGAGDGFVTGNIQTPATWQSKSVVTSATITLPSIERSDNERFVYARNGDMNDLQLKSGRLVTSYTVGSVSISTDTIYYLGRAGS